MITKEGLLAKINYYLKHILNTFIFMWVMLNVFRIVFLVGMQDYVAGTTTWQLQIYALYCGAKLSLQSAGFLTLVMLPVLLLEIWSRKWRYLRYAESLVVVFITSLLFVARFPFYQLYHSGYNQMIFTAAHEDKYALLISMVDQYKLPLRLAVVIVITVLITYAYNKFIEYKGPSCLQYIATRWRTAILLILVYILGTLSLYGGGWSWRSGVNWENAGVTNDPFLNELILDDYQAIYRAHINMSRMEAMNGLSFNTQQVEAYAKFLTGVNGGNDLAIYLKKEAPGATIPKPKHIFIIVSESYANWPLLPKFANLHIADQMKGLLAQPDSYYNGHFLPAGSSTVGALMSMVTGLAQSNLYLTTMPEAMEKPYLTATAPQMERLGYKTAFWYSGPTSWENIQKFTLAQGFDNFYSRGDLAANATGSVWGADDEFLYNEILKRTKAEEDTFDIILNTSNHSPFNIDLAQQGFPKDKVNAALPAKYQNDEELLKELGHFWYADRQAARFIREAQKRFPDSLFIMFGDHADRYNIDKMPNMYERYAIPLMIIGDGINHHTFPADMAGSQIDVIPSLINLIAPKGFVYYSVGQSLSSNKLAENYSFWMNAYSMGNTGEFDKTPYYFGPRGTYDREHIEKYVNAVRAVSWWMGKYGPIIDSSLLQRK